MAGLIGLQAADIDIQDALQVKRWKYDQTWIPHPVVRLTTTLPVAVNEPDGRSIVRARWGFDVGAGRPIGNARDDRLTESKLWSSMLGKSHCLIPSTGIYEQIKEPKKTSLWFRRVDQKPIVMPGLVGERGAKGEKRLCAAIITTEPNDFFKRFHDRTVCTLDVHEMDAWMNAKDTQSALKLLHAPTNDEWEAIPVDDASSATEFGKTTISNRSPNQSAGSDVVKTIEQTVKFAAPAAAVDDVYMDPKKHAKAIGGSAKVSKKVGSLFSAWDDYCRGTMLHLERGQLIVQTWRGSDWRRTDPDSVLILLFTDTGKGSELHMVHANVPDDKAGELAEGWKEHYWAPFKDYLRGT